MGAPSSARNRWPSPRPAATDPLAAGSLPNGDRSRCYAGAASPFNHGPVRPGRSKAVSDEKVVLDHDDLRRTLVRIAHEIVEKNQDSDRLALVGIHTRGAVICRRLHALVGELSGAEVPLGDLDISFYRDDIERREPRDAPVVHHPHPDFDPPG